MMGTHELFAAQEDPTTGWPDGIVRARFSLSRMVASDERGRRETFTYEPPVTLGPGDRYWFDVDGRLTIQRADAIGHEEHFSVERPTGGSPPADVGRVPDMQPIEVHVHNHYGDDEQKDLLRSILRAVRGTNQEVGDLTLDVSALTAAVAAETSLDQSAITLLQNLSSQLSDQPAAQAAIDDAVAQLQASGASLGDAITANTPAAPPTDPGTGDGTGDGTGAGDGTGTTGVGDGTATGTEPGDPVGDGGGDAAAAPDGGAV